MKTTILTDMKQASEQIIAICNIEKDALNELQFDAAIQCLEKVLQSDTFGVYELPKNPGFWAWWLEQWYRRDLLFLNSLELDVELMKYTCTLPDSRARVFVDTELKLKNMYLLFHRISEDNPLVNNNSLEVSFHCMLKDLSIKH
jgi:hypothetical protein